jgi:hypothetical protein
MTVQQSTTAPATDTRPPWSPLSVFIITFIMPAGGAVLTIRNLQRLRLVDARQAREWIIATVVVLALGYTGLLLATKPGPKDTLPRLDSVSALISCGLATASYLVLRSPYRAWRSQHAGARTSSPIPALGIALLYTVITVVAVVPVWIVAASVLHALGVSTVLL